MMNDGRDPSAAVNATELVDGLVHIVRRRDPATGAHLDAVGKLSQRLARELGCDPEFVERVTLAARLHDVGKISTPLSVLNKPGPLDVEEWAEMRMHPVDGATIVESFAPLRPLAEIVRLHHERVDGRGYPDGRIGDDIPLESRIIAVADAFHAMTVARPYAQPRTPALAMEELIHCSGTQFDMEIVATFVTIIGWRDSDVA